MGLSPAQRLRPVVSTILHHGVLLVGLYLFFTGFFPSKLSLPGYAPKFVESEAAPPAQFKRLVIMVVDALRAEFAYRDIGGRPSMPYLREMIQQGKAIPFSAYAHAPTVTLPRIKAIITGGIPSFIDYVGNLNSPELLEDNLIYQLQRAGKRMIFYGDDTWLKLFPSSFTRSDGTTSFFVSDTVEVDNNVTRHIDKEIYETKDWEVMILHYLGLDHIGHSAGPDSPLLPPKLLEMDMIFNRILESFSSDPQTLLVLCGDHGMSEVGSHGGSTTLETHAAFIAASAAFSQNFSSQNLPFYTEQINMVPTLSLLLGVPIPRNSLGSFIPEFFGSWNLLDQLRALKINANQMRQVLKIASSLWIDENTPIPEVANYLKLLEDANALLARYEASNTEPDALKAIEMYQTFLRKTASELSLKLTEYDLPQLLAGFILIVVAAISSIVETFQALSGASAALKSPSRRLTIFSISFLLSFTFIYIGGRLLGQRKSSIPFSAALAAIGGLSTSQAFCMPIQMPKLLWRWDFLPPVTAVTFVVVHILSLGSSSFVEEEHQIVYFFYLTLLIISAVWAANRRSGRSDWISFILTALAAFSIARKWNQTGNKWLGYPDLALYVSTAHPLWSQCLVLFSASVSIWLNHRWATLQNSSISTIYKCVADTTIAIICGYKLDLLEPLGPKIFIARTVFLLIATLLVLSICTRSNDGSKTCSRWRSVFLALVILEFQLIKSINSSVVALIAIQAVCLTSFVTISKLPVFVSTILFFFGGRAAWFCLGNSNSLSSIDLANAYVGLDSYNPISVGILLLLSGYAGPILFSVAQVVTWFEVSSSSSASDFHAILPTMASIRSTTLAVFCVIITLMRYHLFIWSVFSPKFFYECFHTIFTTILYAIILPCYVSLTSNKNQIKSE